MFHEYRDLMAELKHSDAHFAKLFDEHNELDEKITNLEKDPIASHRHDEIDELKKQKLHLKDEIGKILESKK
ncbi:YdcH family protein [Psychrobacter sp. HD31]|uniref:YdcH family protein n=1 Tax=Psychrobacter sp. HD31 TaxID=3112003 RepID=UPI003DA5CDC0